jgi:hypothetical protein
MITPVTLTGCPLNFVGLNFDARAAETAADRNRGFPEAAEAAITLPCSSIVTCTVTEPEALTALAAAGYDGFARYVAFPFKTPPETVLGADFSLGGGVGTG